MGQQGVAAFQKELPVDSHLGIPISLHLRIVKGLLSNVWQILEQGIQHDIPDLFGNGTIFDVKDHSRKVIADVQKFLLRSKRHDLAKGGGSV
jgi:hypothetical protein